MDKDLTYKNMLEAARTDDNIVGFILAAGRGKGFATEYSDYDVIVVVSDGREDEYRQLYSKFDITNTFDIRVFALTDFKAYAEWGSSTAWDRYNFTHLKAQIDKTGDIQAIIDEKGKLSEDKIKETVEENLDAYINSFHRAMKNHRDGNLTAALLDASESVPFLLVSLFALEGRLRPYNKYLEWELENYPLVNLPWGKDVFLGILSKIITTGDLGAQKEVFEKIKQLFSSKGYESVINSWGSYYMG